MKNLLAGMVVLFLLISPLAAERLGCRGPEKYKGDYMAERFDCLITKLDLSDKQIAKMEKVKIKYKKKYLDYAEKLAPQRIRIQKLKLEEPVDYVKIKAILTAMSSVEVELRINKMKHHDEIRSILTPAQRLRFEKYGKPRWKNKGQKKGFFRSR
ncbi:Spy/CpxP family protein refolding chaperone [Candidatus Margulisiibacteriota bacterium]